MENIQQWVLKHCFLNFLIVHFDAYYSQHPILNHKGYQYDIYKYFFFFVRKYRIKSEYELLAFGKPLLDSVNQTYSHVPSLDDTHYLVWGRGADYRERFNSLSFTHMFLLCGQLLQERSLHVSAQGEERYFQLKEYWW